MRHVGAAYKWRLLLCNRLGHTVWYNRPPFFDNDLVLHTDSTLRNESSRANAPKMYISAVIDCSARKLAFLEELPMMTSCLLRSSFSSMHRCVAECYLWVSSTFSRAIRHGFHLCCTLSRSFCQSATGDSFRRDTDAQPRTMQLSSCRMLRTARQARRSMTNACKGSVARRKRSPP